MRYLLIILCIYYPEQIINQAIVISYLDSLISIVAHRWLNEASWYFRIITTVSLERRSARIDGDTEHLFIQIFVALLIVGFDFA